MEQWIGSDFRRCPRSSLLINLQSNRFLCAVWKDRKICPETSQIGASFWFFSSLRFFFFTLITNNLALTYSLKYDNANKMRQCENIFVFIDLTKSIGSDLGGAVPPPAPPPPQTPPMSTSNPHYFGSTLHGFLVYYCDVLMFYNLFGLSFWWHPFTAEDHFLQICPDKTNKLI